MKFLRPTALLHLWKSASLSILSALLIFLAFPDFEFWFLAWVGLVPLIIVIDREKESVVSSFVLGWIWGFVFFTGTCWWLTYAPIHYAGFPTWLAYLLLLCLTAVVGIFPGLFALVLGVLLRRFGSIAVLTAPFVWVFTEFLRYWITGNNWNAIGYSQALPWSSPSGVAGIVSILVLLASLGGVLLTSFILVFINSAIAFAVALGTMRAVVKAFGLTIAVVVIVFIVRSNIDPTYDDLPSAASIVAIQPNVPMSGLTYEKWEELRAKHVELAESALATINEQRTTNTTVIFPESPMNFMWNDDLEFQKFIRTFAAKNDVNVLFNSAEPDGANNKYFNSAVLVGPDGKELAQYDKIYLLPFGESVPAPLQSIVPAFVGSFSYGKEYDLLPLGGVEAGVMICFESHFGELGREYARNGADVLIEMTNDGYLGPTPVLRQHLANAVFRAVETNRPVLRVTNVGVTAYISENGSVLDPATSYTEATRVWSVRKSDGKQTFYVRYGDWYAWLCSVVTVGLLILGLLLKRSSTETET